MQKYLWSALLLLTCTVAAVWFVAGQRSRPLTMAERLKLKPPKAEPQVNNGRVPARLALQFPEHLPPLVLRESEASEHIEPRPQPEGQPSSVGDPVSLVQGPIVDTPSRPMPPADEPESTIDEGEEEWEEPTEPSEGGNPFWQLWNSLLQRMLTTPTFVPSEDVEVDVDLTGLNSLNFDGSVQAQGDDVPQFVSCAVDPAEDEGDDPAETKVKKAPIRIQFAPVFVSPVMQSPSSVADYGPPSTSGYGPSASPYGPPETLWQAMSAAIQQTIVKAAVSRIDWVQYYKSHGYGFGVLAPNRWQINQPIVMTEMRWTFPSGAYSGVYGGYGPPGCYGPPSGPSGVEVNKLTLLNQVSSLAGSLASAANSGLLGSAFSQGIMCGSCEGPFFDLVETVTPEEAERNAATPEIRQKVAELTTDALNLIQEGKMDEARNAYIEAGKLMPKSVAEVVAATMPSGSVLLTPETRPLTGLGSPIQLICGKQEETKPVTQIIWHGFKQVELRETQASPSKPQGEVLRTLGVTADGKSCQTPMPRSPRDFFMWTEVQEEKPANVSPWWNVVMDAIQQAFSPNADSNEPALPPTWTDAASNAPTPLELYKQRIYQTPRERAKLTVEEERVQRSWRDYYDLPSPTEQPKMSVEEERLQRFWHDYYGALASYYKCLEQIDWVAFYKNHGTISHRDETGVRYAPVFVGPTVSSLGAGAAGPINPTMSWAPYYYPSPNLYYPYSYPYTNPYSSYLPTPGGPCGVVRPVPDGLPIRPTTGYSAGVAAESNAFDGPSAFAPDSYFYAGSAVELSYPNAFTPPVVSPPAIGPSPSWRVPNCEKTLPAVTPCEDRGGFCPPAAPSQTVLHSPDLSNPQRIQIKFTRPIGMKVYWFCFNPDGPAMFSKEPLETPGRYNFIQGATYRLKLADIEDRPLMEFYPTVEVLCANAKTQDFLAHSAVPVNFTDDDFRQVIDGNYLVKVVYLPDPTFQEQTGAGLDEILSSRLAPGTDPVCVARNRGTPLLIVRMGNVDQELSSAPRLNPGPVSAKCNPSACAENTEQFLVQQHEKLVDAYRRYEAASSACKGYGKVLQGYCEDIRAGKMVAADELEIAAAQLASTVRRQSEAIAAYNKIVAGFGSLTGAGLQVPKSFTVTADPSQPKESGQTSQPVQVLLPPPPAVVETAAPELPDEAQAAPQAEPVGQAMPADNYHQGHCPYMNGQYCPYPHYNTMPAPMPESAPVEASPVETQPVQTAPPTPRVRSTSPWGLGDVVEEPPADSNEAQDNAWTKILIDAIIRVIDEMASKPGQPEAPTATEETPVPEQQPEAPAAAMPSTDYHQQYPSCPYLHGGYCPYPHYNTMPAPVAESAPMEALPAETQPAPTAPIDEKPQMDAAETASNDWTNRVIVAAGRVVGNAGDTVLRHTTQIKVYHLRIVLAEDVASTLATFPFQNAKETLVVTAEPITNRLIVIGSPQAVETITQFIRALDAAPVTDEPQSPWQEVLEECEPVRKLPSEVVAETIGDGIMNFVNGVARCWTLSELPASTVPKNSDVVPVAEPANPDAVEPQTPPAQETPEQPESPAPAMSNDYHHQYPSCPYLNGQVCQPYYRHYDAMPVPPAESTPAETPPSQTLPAPTVPVLEKPQTNGTPSPSDRPNSYAGQQPWWNIFAKRTGLNPEEKREAERLQRFWHDYCESMKAYYGTLEIDWVAYYKTHACQINTGGGTSSYPDRDPTEPRNDNSQAIRAVRFDFLEEIFSGPAGASTESGTSWTERARRFFLRVLGVDPELGTDLRADGSY